MILTQARTQDSSRDASLEGGRESGSQVSGLAYEIALSFARSLSVCHYARLRSITRYVFAVCASRAQLRAYRCGRLGCFPQVVTACYILRARLRIQAVLYVS